MYTVLLVAVAVYLLCTAYSGYASVEKLKKGIVGERERIRRYRFSVVWNATSAALVFLAVAATPITLNDIGFRPMRLDFPGGSRVLLSAALILCGAFTALLLYQMAAFLLSPAYRDSVKRSLQAKRDVGGLYEKVVDNLIPRTKQEKRWFAITALAAGVCEELVFRGFLFFLLCAVFPAASNILLAVSVGLLFGLAHFYQGLKGIVKTALLGALFGLLYIGTDSILPCIALHFLFDLSSAFLYEAEAEADGGSF